MVGDAFGGDPFIVEAKLLMRVTGGTRLAAHASPRRHERCATPFQRVADNYIPARKRVSGTLRLGKREGERKRKGRIGTG